MIDSDRVRLQILHSCNESCDLTLKIKLGWSVGTWKLHALTTLGALLRYGNTRRKTLQDRGRGCVCIFVAHLGWVCSQGWLDNALKFAVYHEGINIRRRLDEIYSKNGDSRSS